MQKQRMQNTPKKQNLQEVKNNFIKMGMSIKSLVEARWINRKWDLNIPSFKMDDIDKKIE